MYVERTLEGLIKKYLPKNEIIAVTGPRQSGKTTLLKHVLEDVPNVNIITFEDVSLLNLFQNEIESFIELHIRGFEYVFIDEIQYAKNSGKQLKYIYDTQNVKLLLSGSSSTEISIQSLKYLVGRIFVFELYPFSFEEFLLAKDSKLYKLYKTKAFGMEIVKKLQRYINEFMMFGGYPRVVLSESDEEKITVLKNIYNTLLLREVKDLTGIGDNEKLIKLIKALSLQVGNLINYSALCDIAGFSFPTLKKNINILELLFICSRCYPYSKNSKTELVKNPKIYFVDYGLRNIIINNFNTERPDKGALYENLIYAENIKKGNVLKFWRTKAGAEVDFIYNGEPIEIKTKPKIGKSLHSFIAKYSPGKAFVISEIEKEAVMVNGTEIFFVPFVKFV